MALETDGNGGNGTQLIQQPADNAIYEKTAGSPPIGSLLLELPDALFCSIAALLLKDGKSFRATCCKARAAVNWDVRLIEVIT